MGTNIDTAGTVFGEFVMVHDGSQGLGISETSGNNVVIHYERVMEPPAPPIRNERCTDGIDRRY